MPQSAATVVTSLSDGEHKLGDFLPCGSDQLRCLAKHLVRRRFHHPLCTTSLVHETYLRLARHPDARCSGSDHFLAIAAQAMRQVLVDLARQRKARKRGCDYRRVPLDDHVAVSPIPDVDIFATDQALRKLASIDARRARIVELRFFGGLTVEETARVLGISPATVKREWPLARAWLHREIRET